MKYHIIWDSYSGIAVPEGRVRQFVEDYVNNGGGQLCIADMEIFAEIRIYVKSGAIPYTDIIITDTEDRTFYIDKKGCPTHEFWRYNCKLYDDQLHAIICC